MNSYYKIGDVFEDIHSHAQWILVDIKYPYSTPHNSLYSDYQQYILITNCCDINIKNKVLKILYKSLLYHFKLINNS